MKRRKKHKASILQEKDGRCYLCMMLNQDYTIRHGLHEHHIFGGANRQNSEAEGLKVYLCVQHHIDGPAAVHNNSENMRILQEAGQQAYERTHTRQQFCLGRIIWIIRRTDMDLMDMISKSTDAGIKEFREMLEMPTGMIDWLEREGFFCAPAAKKHHGAFVGGLWKHSLQVAKELQKLTEGMKLQWTRKESPIVVGLLHDVCKIDDYMLIEDDTDLKGYRIEWNAKRFLDGHGDKSVILLQQYCMQSGDFILTPEEMLCIRYHMGAFTDKKEWEYYNAAIAEFPNVLYTHTADMIASQVMGI